MPKPPRSLAACRALALAAALGVTLAAPAAVRADETVRQVQEELRKRNLYFGDVDGTLAPPTAAALRRYQQRKGFPATGQPDAVTLDSLMIAVPAPAYHAAAGVSAPSPNPARNPAWPDVTVLRSDVGRDDLPPDADLPAGADPTPVPTPVHVAPPPPAADRPRLTPADVRAFVEHYIRAGAANDPPAELAFFGDRVDYFGEGIRDRRYIERDITRYDRRWPERHFTVLEPFSVTPSPDGDPGKTRVSFRLQFSNKGARFAVQGKTDNVWTLLGSTPADLRIVSIQEQRVRE